MDDNKRNMYLRFFAAADKLNDKGKEEAVKILKDMLSQNKYRETSQREIADNVLCSYRIKRCHLGNAVNGIEICYIRDKCKIVKAIPQQLEEDIAAILLSSLNTIDPIFDSEYELQEAGK